MKPHRPSLPTAAQQGFVLILALIMLVVLSAAAAWSAKAAISGEQIANNLRIVTTAQQSAEMALRFCENQMIAGNPAGMTVNMDGSTEPDKWKTRSNWGTLAYTLLPADVTGSADITVAVPPKCMVEELRLAQSDMQSAQAYLITARGFSPDYTADTDTLKTKTGTDVWLQSSLRF